MADVKAAGAIIFTRGLNPRCDTPLYLVLRSAKHGEWGPPKGKADTGETEMETAIREIAEETGIRRLQFQPGFREALRYEVYKKGHLFYKESVYFLAEAESGVSIQLSKEHSQARIAPLDEVEELLNHDDIKSLFYKAHAFIVSNHISKHKA
jgi:8-oxo-dGTP pyrophosphatase MutT (NUDIX family)